MLLDVCVLTACLALVILARYRLGGQFAPRLYLPLVWTLGLYLFLALLTGVYAPLQTPPEVIKRLSGAISSFFLMLAFLVFLNHDAAVYSRLIFLVSWALSLAVVPMARGLAARLAPALFCWRPRCVLIGTPEQTRLMSERLAHPRAPLWPAAVSLPPGAAGFPGLPVIPFEELPAFARENPHCYALLFVNARSQWPPANAMDRLSLSFRHVLLQSPQIDQISTWTYGVRLGGVTLLTSQFKLLDPWRMLFKRAFDVAFCLTVGLAFLPLLGLLSLLIRLDSPGPAFFSQTRLGQGGRSFRILKFRTMYLDAEQRLGSLLAQDKALACQWKDNQKLACDPRITRVGAWLRKTSIDELPQLFNVLLGTMSLVGPRPIVEGEVERYAEHYATYIRVKPGITGLWQISGRNRTAYTQRVALDVSYVRNWSIYMDLWILARTSFEVFRLTGC